jgi:hypothetical protein
MGQSVTAQRTKGSQSVEERLETMVQHIGDSAVVHGTLQEVCSIINKNPTEREKFCEILIRASSQQESLGLPPNWMPFSELFAKVRFMQDANSRSSVIAWLRYLSDFDDERSIDIFVRSDISAFISDFYSFQANSHVAPEALSSMAQLLQKWAANDLFAAQLDSHDTFRIVLPRLRFSRVGSEERAHLLHAMTRCYAGGLCRAETLELLLKIALDRDELSDAILCSSINMIAQAVRKKPELSKNISCKQVTTLCRHLQGSGDVIAATAHLLAHLYASVVTADGLAVSTASPEDAGKSSSVLRVVVEALEQLFRSDYLDVANMPAETLVSARLITLHNEENVSSFVNSASGAFSALVARSHPSLRSTDVALGLIQVIQRAISLYPGCVAVVVRTPLVIDCFMDILVASPPTVLPSAVEVFVALCNADSASCITICESRPFQLALRSVSTLLESGAKSEERNLAVVQIMKALLVAQVISQADGLLVLTMYGIICKILGTSTVSSQYQAVNVPATKTIEVALELLLVRCRLGPSFAESVLGLLPIDVVREVLSAAHLAEASELARRLVDSMAHSSTSARMELEMYGCVEGVKGSAKKLRTTLRAFQIHFRMIRYLRKTSRIRSELASATKNSFLICLEICDEEREQRSDLYSRRDQTMNYLRAQAVQRQEVEKTHERQAASLRRTERNARQILQQKAIDNQEQVRRASLLREESSQRLSLPEQSKIILEEISARSRITDGEYIVQRDITFTRISRFLATAREFSLRVNSVMSEETLERRTTERLHGDWVAKMKLHDRIFLLSCSESETRTALDARLTEEHVAMASSMFEMLLSQTKKDLHEAKKALDDEVTAWRVGAFRHWRELQLMSLEDSERNGCERLANLACGLLARHFVTMATGTVRREEASARSALSRVLIRSWKQLLITPHAIINACADEELRRHEICRQERLGLNMALEALRYTLPLVCESEELSKRASIDGQYHSFSLDCMWRLAELKLYFDETGARNAVALQYFFVARTIVTPFVCIRLLDYQRRLLQRDKKLRVGLWIEEKAAFNEILVAEVKDEQRLRRKNITAELRVEEERLARHFVSVTHVVKLQEAAQELLSKRLPPRRHPQPEPGTVQ